MTLTIKASWIKENREGRNDNWSYDYKELLLNDNPAHISYIRIPINAPGTKAIEYNADGGITNEYEQVYVYNDGNADCLHHCTTTRFDIRYTATDHADHLTERVKTLSDECSRLNEANRILAESNQQLTEGSEAIAAKLTIAEQEIVTLKAKLYDLMTSGAQPPRIPPKTRGESSMKNTIHPNYAVIRKYKNGNLKHDIFSEESATAARKSCREVYRHSDYEIVATITEPLDEIKRIVADKLKMDDIFDDGNDIHPGGKLHSALFEAYIAGQIAAMKAKEVTT